MFAKKELNTNFINDGHTHMSENEPKSSSSTKIAGAEFTGLTLYFLNQIL